MNYNDLMKQLDEYTIKREEMGGDVLIYVYPKNNNGSSNLDVGIKLENSSSSQIWCLYEVQRDKSFELGNFSSEETGLLALYIAVKGNFEKIKGNDLVKRELREIEKDPVAGKVILQKNIKENYFSLEQVKEGAINLVEVNQSYDVFYLNQQKEKIVITEARPLSSALVVLYNFSIKLEKFEELIKPFRENIALEEVEKIKKIYICK